MTSSGGSRCVRVKLFVNIALQRCSQDDSGNPFDSEKADMDSLKICLLMCSPFFFILLVGVTSPDENTRRERAIPMTNSQRQALKEFIMKKEAEALLPSEVMTDSRTRRETKEVLETGAVDCFYGLHTLYQKLLVHEYNFMFGASKAAHEERVVDTPDTVSNAGWLKAVAEHQVDEPHGRASDAHLDAEEERIARMLFEAADLDDQHSISFTEFAMLAVLLSATDARDADAQVCVRWERTPVLVIAACQLK
jgi:hypothetical protein